VHRVPLEALPFNAPATRQLYGDVGGLAKSAGQLYFVHAPPQPWFFQDNGLPEPSCVEIVHHTGALMATFTYSSVATRDKLIKAILSACPRDVFVTPAAGRGKSTDRIADWGHRLLSEERFERFVSKTFKYGKGTQTSDKKC